MKEWQGLLQYSDYYTYVKSDEEIHIKIGPEINQAFEEYMKVLESFGENANLRWELDIALDCIRDMSEKDKAYVLKHMSVSYYHFGYAMGIRNEFIYPASKHKTDSADDTSGEIMEMIFSILSPVYDYRDKVLTHFFAEVGDLYAMYVDVCPKVFKDLIDEIINRGENDNYDHADEILKERLKAELGQDDFIRLYREAKKDFEADEKKQKDPDWFWGKYFRRFKAILYPLEATQMNILREYKVFERVQNGWLWGENACKEYIDEKFGFRKECTDFLARCTWEIFNPIAAGTWESISIDILELPRMQRDRLRAREIKTLGDLCNHTFEEIAAIRRFGEEGAASLQAKLKEMGLDLKAENKV